MTYDTTALFKVIKWEIMYDMADYCSMGKEQ